MSALLAALYVLCLLALAGFALAILHLSPRSRLHRYFALLALALLGWVASLFAFDFPLALAILHLSPRSRLHRYFALLALALLGWVASLFAFDFPLAPAALLWTGRLNFASVVLAVTLGYRFVRAVAGLPPGPSTRWLWAETALLAGVTLLTPLVDQKELVRSGVHVTLYGPLFAPYLLHVLALLGASLAVTFGSQAKASGDTRSQLRLIGAGAAATASVALVTNALLPYALGDFRFIHVGTVSTLLFLAAVGYAVFAHHLFSVRVIVRAAFVVAGLVALALEVYSLAVSFLAHLIPLGGADERLIDRLYHADRFYYARHGDRAHSLSGKGKRDVARLK